MLENVPILSLLLIVPFIGAMVTLLLGTSPKASKYLALAFSGITLALSVLLLFNFSLSSTEAFQFRENYVWIQQLGISYNLAVDGISLPMVFLSALLVFLSILFSWDVEERTRTYMGLMLILEVGVLGVFMALDYFLFYVFWEVVLIPMYFLIAIWGGPSRAYASIKFFIYTHIASLVMLLGIFALYFTASPLLGSPSFGMESIASVAGSFGHDLALIVFSALLFGFIVKMPMVPFHTWLPDAHVQAPTAGSVLLAGLLLKMGSYGVIRVCITTFNDLSHEATIMVALAVIGVVSIIYGAFACLAQTDLKKMVAYSSISHMGIVLLGIATMTELGLAAAVFQMFSHGLITAVLFMTCGMFQHKAGTREIPLLGGLAPKMPIVATIMMIGFMASLGLPGLVGFIAEFSVFTATYNIFDLWVLIPVMSVAITAAYYIWAMQRTIFGDLTTKIDTKHIHDSYWFETMPLAVLIGLIALFGIFPSLLMDIILPSVAPLAAVI
ncbi:MAG: F(420)H(2) dehydrogenase subunit M [Methanomassiliicoccales archaeon PtaU1.Bin030]|nr:MAG: F(420)H(2) dehydrogenase subunit M [Methanomassiliicoccales archaeon PtaU1.Bin030]